MMTNLLRSAFAANKLFSTIARLRLLLVMFLTLTASTAWGAEEVVYTLTPASGSNNSYAGNCDVTIDDIEWNLTGNSTTTYWRIGGKSINNVDRALYSKTPIQEDISKIVISHGAASSITVNSVTLIVSTAADGAGTTISTLSSSFSVNSTMTFTRPAGTSWANAYYKFVYNVTVSGGSNKYVEFKEAKFYAETTPAVPFIVTLMDDPENPLEESSAGAGVFLPSRESCDGYTFAGWTKSWFVAQTTWTTTAPTIIPDGSYTPTANESLYPVYTKTEGGTPVPATLTASYTSNSGWTATNCGGSSYWVLKSGASITSPVISDLSTVTSITFKVRTYGGDTYKTVNVSTSRGTSIGSASASSTTLTLKTINVSPKLSGNGSIVFSSNTTSSSYGPGINEITINYSTGGSTTYYISVPDCTTETTVCLVHKYGRARYGLVPDGNGVLTVW